MCEGINKKLITIKLEKDSLVFLPRYKPVRVDKVPMSLGMVPVKLFDAVEKKTNNNCNDIIKSNEHPWLALIYLHKNKVSIDSNRQLSCMAESCARLKADWTEIEPVSWFVSKLRISNPEIDVISTGKLPTSSLLCKWSSFRVKIFPNSEGMTPVKRLLPVGNNNMKNNKWDSTERAK